MCVCVCVCVCNFIVHTTQHMIYCTFRAKETTTDIMQPSTAQACSPAWSYTTVHDRHDNVMSTPVNTSTEPCK